MKTKIIAVFCSFLLCVSIFACFPINALAAASSSGIVFSKSLCQPYSTGFDVRDMSPQDMFYFCTKGFADSLFDDVHSISGCLISLNSSGIYCYVFSGNLDFINYDDKRNSISTDQSDVYYFSYNVTGFSDYYVHDYDSIGTARSGMWSSFTSCEAHLSDPYIIVYSDYDIYFDDDLIHSSDRVDPLAMNDDWFDITCDPQLSDDMSFSTTYTDPKGNEQTAADYTLDVTISKTGDMFKDSSYEHLLNYYTQCFMFVSTEPVSDRDYSAALNSCIYLHYENRQYYGNVVFDADYTVKDDFELWTGKSFDDKYVHEPVAGSRSMGVTSYSLITGYVPYAVFSGSNDAHYTVDLNGVPLEAGQTYYITVLAFPMSSTFLRNSDLSSSYPMTSLSFRSAVDDSLDESGNFSPQQLIQDAEDISGVFVVGKSAAFSLNNLNGYKFVDKSSEFGVDPYTYSDDKLHADKYEDTITDRTDYTKKGNGFTTDTPPGGNILGGVSSGNGFNDILASFKSVVPFYSEVVHCLPENIQPLLLFLIVFPLVFLVIGIIIGGIKWLISLFTG